MTTNNVKEVVDETIEKQKSFDVKKQAFQRNGNDALSRINDIFNRAANGLGPEEKKPIDSSSEILNQEIKEAVDTGDIDGAKALLGQSKFVIGQKSSATARKLQELRAKQKKIAAQMAQEESKGFTEAKRD